MKAIDGTGLAEVIRARYQAGAIVGGTSAGAAVISEAMITGDADLQSLTAQKTVIAKGLGLWPEVIVDQHFLKRQRDNRLISAVIDHPSLVGVGIDESTAVVVHGGSFDVIGESSVVVIDARDATVEPSSASGLGGCAEPEAQRAPHRHVVFAEVGVSVRPDCHVQFLYAFEHDVHTLVASGGPVRSRCYNAF